MEQHDVEIIINKAGEVEVRSRGVKGEACRQYRKLFEQIVGRIKGELRASDYYEPETKARIDVEQNRGR